jgi:hypothetical protein
MVNEKGIIAEMQSCSLIAEEDVSRGFSLNDAGNYSPSFFQRGG